MISPIRLDLAGLERMRETFLSRMDDFGDFGDVPSRYHADERAYKDELVRLCNATLTPELFAARTGPEDPEHDQTVIDAALKVLTTRLESTGTPQNFVVWRNIEVLRQMTGVERAVFAPALGPLLHGSSRSEDRLDAFVPVMWPIWRRIRGGNPYAATRLIPTFFLMLRDPRNDMAVRSDLVSRLVKLLLNGETILQYQPFNGANYRRVLALAGAVRDVLQRWGWYPRDLIDVQSFMWLGTRTPQELGVTDEAEEG